MAHPTFSWLLGTRYAAVPAKLFSSSRLKQLSLGAIAAAALLSFAQPALAHHPFGGEMPANMLEGFLSGIGHPVIGLDHLAFVIAAGLVAATRPKGFFIPLAFVAASLLGTGLHLQLLSLPAPEIVISASVLLFGVILAMGRKLSLQVVAALAALSGVFHGYAYGEAIFGAEPSPMIAYLAGFAIIQTAIALLCFTIGRSVARSSAIRSSAIRSSAIRSSATEPSAINPFATVTPLGLRFAGFTLAGVGMAFLSSTVLG